MKLNLREYRRLWSQELPRPIDVLNLIELAPNDAYATYAKLVSPLLMLLGTRIAWAGEHVGAIAGERQAGKLLVVSYRSHRRFMALMNPYMLAINRWRVRGVERFQASWTARVRKRPGLRRQRTMVAVHLSSPDGAHDAPSRPTLDALEEVMEEAGATLLYASVECSPISFLEDLEPADPNPLTYPETLLFGVESPEAATEALDADVLRRVEAIAPGAVLQIYRRLRVAELLG